MLERHEVEVLLTTMSFRPSSDGLWVSEDGEVGAALRNASLLVGWCDTEWAHPPSPRRVLRDVQQVVLDRASESLPTSLDAAITNARTERAVAVCVCESCGKDYVPGQMHDRWRCHGCVERELGVVH